MAKRKEYFRGRRPPKRSTAKLFQQIDEAMSLHKAGESEEARNILLRLAKANPRSQPVLLAIMELCQETEDWQAYAYYGEKLLPLEKGDDRAETLNNLVYAFVQILYPALAWHYAQELTANHPDFVQLAEVRKLQENMEQFLLDQADKLEVAPGQTREKKLEIMVAQDRVRFYTEGGYPAEAIQAAEKVLKKSPNLAPILNNLSFSQFQIGEVEQSIATAQKVLAGDPYNIHALSNLVRFTFLTAQFDRAREYAARLEQVSSDKPDLEVKQAEAFAYLGEDEKILAAYDQAKAKSHELHPSLLHLAAVAYLRTGDEKRTWQLWRQARKMAPTFDLAKRCLAERRLPAGERDVPWYWSLQYWFPNNNELDGAESLLQEIIGAAPDFPSPYNQLAVVYEQHNRPQEARALVEETHARFPDYFFARIALARIMIRDEKVEEAQDLLDPLLRRKNLHISEFRALAGAEMEIALSLEKPEAARLWLDMWRQMEEDNPEIHEWELRIAGPGKIMEGLRKLRALSKAWKD